MDNKIKLIAIDMDGTLLNSENKISAANLTAISKARANNVKVVLATGRPFSLISSYLDQLGINDEGEYVIAYNGAAVREINTKAMMSYHPLTYDDFLTIQNTADKFKICTFFVTTSAGYATSKKLVEYLASMPDLVKIPAFYKPASEITSDYEFVYAIFFGNDSVLPRVMETLPKSFTDKYSISHSGKNCNVVSQKDANKGAALKFLSQTLGLTIEEVMAIGDDENDVLMFENAGISVAMGNSSDFVKSRAKFVTKTNNEDGVAAAICEHALEK